MLLSEERLRLVHVDTLRSRRFARVLLLCRLPDTSAVEQGAPCIGRRPPRPSADRDQSDADASEPALWVRQCEGDVVMCDDRGQPRKQRDVPAAAGSSAIANSR